MAVKSLISILLISQFSFLISGAHAQTTPVKVSPDGHFLEYQGRRILLIGDSVTQGWMELGPNFNQTEYLDTLSSKGINTVLLWAYIGIVNQVQDARIGYDAPEIWPWSKSGSIFNLSQFNQNYFNRLNSFISYAESKGIIVILTVHDGWTKERFAGHPFNSALGGPLSSKEQYVDLGISANKQYQEAFAQKLISELSGHSNLLFEMFNEGEWYDSTSRNQHEQNFLQYFNSRTGLPLITNSDYISLDTPRNDSKVDIISYHYSWTASTTALNLFNRFAPEFNQTPAKPFFLSETVPDYDGGTSVYDPLMRIIWGTALGGAGIAIQNDASFGFDPNTNIASQKSNLLKLLDLQGYAAKFFSQSIADLTGMSPQGSLSSTGVVLSRPGDEYIIYSQSGTSFTVNLSASTGTLSARFYNPRTGQFQTSFNVTGGSASQSFTKPDSSDWVLHLKKTGGPTSTPGSSPTPTRTPTPVPGSLISNLVVYDTVNASAWSIQTNLQSGNTQYGDRTYTWTTVPSLVAGSQWIRTAQLSRSYTGSPVATFSLTAPATVYIAFDDRYTEPSWMSGYTDTGQDMVNSEPNPYSLYSASYSSPQTISLGPVGSGSYGMYSVIARAASAPTSTPTRTPTPAPSFTPTPVPVPGDGNGDGHVNGVDYMIWFIHYRQSVFGPSNGDYNSSGYVDGVDYMVWFTNYGR